VSEAVGRYHGHYFSSSFGYFRDYLLVKKNAPGWSAKTLTFSLGFPRSVSSPFVVFSSTLPRA